MTNNGKNDKQLRAGFTTGTAAAAATKAALIKLLLDREPEQVPVLLLNGETWQIPIHKYVSEPDGAVSCGVIKDAGDDPDVTNGAEIGARVWVSENRKEQGQSVEVVGGKGVGRVTKPGLEVPPGAAAINPGPMKMIRRAAREELEKHRGRYSARIEIFVPEGEALAQKTLNFRLGIVGGISILGTTGVVKPLSHEAYVATICSALSVARAMNIQSVVFTTGRRSERFAMGLMNTCPTEAFVQIGDYFARSMKMAADMEFDRVTLAVFFGKAVKMAQGFEHTHAGSSRLSLNRLAGWIGGLGGPELLVEKVQKANTAREVFYLVRDDFPQIVDETGRRLLSVAGNFSDHGVKVSAVIFDFEGSPFWRGSLEDKK